MKKKKRKATTYVFVLLAILFVVAVWIANVHVDLSFQSNHASTSTQLWVVPQQAPQTTDEISPMTKPEPEISNNKNKPWFLMHVGPPKTGTTYLQSSLCGRNTAPEHDPFVFLAKDNITYLGTCPGRARKGTLPHSINTIVVGLDHKGNPIHNTTAKLHFRFQIMVQEQAMLRRNVLLIFEGLHRLSARLVVILRQFLELHFRVRVWVAYRPLYEWLPSKYNSVHKVSRNPSARAWPGQLTPGNITGKVLLPFDMDHRGNFSKLVVRPLEEQQMHISHMVLRLFRELGGIQDAQVIRLPATASTRRKRLRSTDTEYLAYLLCDVLNATHTCNAYRYETLLPSRSVNPSEPFDGDLLAVEAYALGQIPSHIADRERVAQKAQAFYDQHLKAQNHSVSDALDSASSSWTTCLPNATLERLYHLSWTTHAKLFLVDKETQQRQQEEEQRHRAGFARNLYRFCYANATAVLQSQEWNSFLPTLLAEMAEHEKKRRAKTRVADGDLSEAKRTKRIVIAAKKTKAASTKV